MSTRALGLEAESSEDEARRGGVGGQLQEALLGMELKARPNLVPQRYARRGALLLPSGLARTTQPARRTLSVVAGKICVPSALLSRSRASPSYFMPCARASG